MKRKSVDNWEEGQLFVFGDDGEVLPYTEAPPEPAPEAPAAPADEAPSGPVDIPAPETPDTPDSRPDGQ